MHVASKVENLRSKFGHARPLGSPVICCVCDGRTDGQTKSTLTTPFPSGGGIKILRLRDRCADVDQTWRVHSVSRGTKLRGTGILNFGLCDARGHRELSPVGTDDPHRAGCFCLHDFSYFTPCYRLACLQI